MQYLITAFNTLATAIATARPPSGHILDVSRANVMSNKALNEMPDRLNRDRRLVLLSDPVTMSRMHYRVWAAPEILFVGRCLSSG
jgi:membrane glycosyltransferase